MAKQGFTLNSVKSVLLDRQENIGWALCIGAGISLPMFPDWIELVRRLAEKDLSPSEIVTVLPSVQKKFSPDALIQAARDRLGLDEDQFAKLLSEVLYQDIKQKLNQSEWDCFTKVMASRHIRSASSDSKRFLGIVHKHYPTVTASALASLIAGILGSKSAPSAILSFNAEPLLFALINAETAAMKSAHRTPPDVLDLVTSSISYRRKSRIPFIFCHGLVDVPGNYTSQFRGDRLVFSETSYLQLANNSFSWQSSSFIDIAMSKSVVFLGVSLSDPNMRRWLTWINANRIREILAYQPTLSDTAIHYWITIDPQSASEKRWIESTVAHLGVRLIWIEEWSQASAAIKKMLGIS